MAHSTKQVTLARSAVDRRWEKIRFLVEDRWVTLEGEVEWYYQRERAEEAVRRVRGVGRFPDRAGGG
jgi:osmotically-inducible protein OsmY